MNLGGFALTSQPGTRPRVRLRPTMQSDLEYVLSLEQDPQNLEGGFDSMLVASVLQSEFAQRRDARQELPA